MCYNGRFCTSRPSRPPNIEFQVKSSDGKIMKFLHCGSIHSPFSESLLKSSIVAEIDIFGNFFWLCRRCELSDNWLWGWFRPPRALWTSRWSQDEAQEKAKMAPASARVLTVVDSPKIKFNQIDDLAKTFSNQRYSVLSLVVPKCL